MKTSCGEHPSSCKEFGSCKKNTECILERKEEEYYRKDLLDNLSKNETTKGDNPTNG